MMQITRKIRNAPRIILCGLFAVSEALLCVQIHKMNIFPEKLMIGMVVGMVLGTIVLARLLFLRKNQAEKKSWRVAQALFMVLTVLLAFQCFSGYQALSKLDQTFNTVTKTPAVTAQIGIYVMTDDPAESLDACAGYTVALTPSYGGETSQTLLDNIPKTISSSVNIQNFDTVPAMISALYLGNVQAVILNKAYVSLLNDLDGFADFAAKTRLIYQYDVLNQHEKSKPERLQNSVYEPMVVYLSGSDSPQNEITQSRSDVNILAAINPKTKQILLVNTPRDYYVPNTAFDSRPLDKLTHCGIYGIDCSMQTLSELYKQPISYHVRVSFLGFKTLIDAIGGISIYSKNGDGVLLLPGENKMDGASALKFVRNRFDYADGDYARGRHQMQVIQAVVKQVASKISLSNYDEILDSLEGLFVTSIPSEMMTAYIKMQLADQADWEVFSYTVTGFGSTEVTASAPGIPLYVMIPDTRTVDHGSELIGKILSGDKLSKKEIELNSSLEQ